MMQDSPKVEFLETRDVLNPTESSCVRHVRFVSAPPKPLVSPVETVPMPCIGVAYMYVSSLYLIRRQAAHPVGNFNETRKP